MRETDLHRMDDDGAPPPRVPDHDQDTRRPTVADEIDRANVIRLEYHDPLWQATIGPQPGAGLAAVAITPEGAAELLMTMCRDLGWAWDASWREKTVRC